MIALDNGDKIRGDASAATVVDYILSGTDANAIKQLADGQLPAGIGDLYTADSADAVTSIILVNTDSVARTVNLYLTPSGGSDRRLIPKDMTLGIGHSLYTDGRNITVLDASGQVLSTWAVDDTPVDGETDKPISSNWAYDHVAAADPHTGYLLESLLDAHSMVMAISDNTPVVLTVAASRFVGRKASGNIAAMTGAEALAVLSGQAGATFNFNSQALTGLGTLNTHTLPGGTDTIALLAASQVFTNKTLTSPTINGTIATTGLTMPAFAAGGHIDMRTYSMVNLFVLKGRDNQGLLLYAQTDMTTATEKPIEFYTLNAASDIMILALSIQPNGANPYVQLEKTLNLNGQVFDAGSGTLRVNSTGTEKGFHAVATQNAISGASIILEQEKATITTSDRPGLFQVKANDLNGVQHTWGIMEVDIINVAQNAEVGRWRWYIMNSGSLNVGMELSGAGLGWFDVGVDADEYYKVAGTQVVSAQGAAVADPTDPASTQARLTDLLGRLRTHGLIAV